VNVSSAAACFLSQPAGPPSSLGFVLFSFFGRRKLTLPRLTALLAPATSGHLLFPVAALVGGKSEIVEGAIEQTQFEVIYSVGTVINLHFLKFPRLKLSNRAAPS
jgi:hypothetical protein